MWSIPILTGVLAFIGAIAGHFVAFDLNAKAKRRDVRRAHIEKFAELIAEDDAWLSQQRNSMQFGDGKYPSGSAPFDKAKAIYRLYFSPEIDDSMKALIDARSKHVMAISTCWTARLMLAQNMEKVIATPPPQTNVDAVTQTWAPYYAAVGKCLGASSFIANETIPEKSQIVSWYGDAKEQISKRMASGNDKPQQ